MTYGRLYIEGYLRKSISIYVDRYTNYYEQYIQELMDELKKHNIYATLIAFNIQPYNNDLIPAFTSKYHNNFSFQALINICYDNNSFLDELSLYSFEYFIIEHIHIECDSTINNYSFNNEQCEYNDKYNIEHIGARKVVKL